MSFSTIVCFIVKSNYLTLLEVQENIVGVLWCLEWIRTTFTVKIFNIGWKNPLWLGIFRREVDSCLRITL